MRIFFCTVAAFLLWSGAGCQSKTVSMKSSEGEVSITLQPSKNSGPQLPSTPFGYETCRLSSDGSAVMKRTSNPVIVVDLTTGKQTIWPVKSIALNASFTAAADGQGANRSEQLHLLPGPTSQPVPIAGNVQAYRWGGDRYLVYVESDGECYVYDTETRESRKVEAPELSSSRPTQSPRADAWVSANGNIVAYHRDDQVAVLIDLDSGESSQHGEGVVKMALTSDGAKMVIAEYAREGGPERVSLVDTGTRNVEILPAVAQFRLLGGRYLQFSRREGEEETGPHNLDLTTGGELVGPWMEDATPDGRYGMTSSALYENPWGSR